MSSPAPATRRPLLLLAGAWLVAVVYLVVYAWLTVSAYTRIVFRPEPRESAQALRDCRAVPACAPDAVHYVDHQQSILDATTLVVRGSAWFVLLLDVVVLAVATVAVVGRRGAVPVRFLRIAWKAEAAVVVVLLVAYLALLGNGSSVLGGTPKPARMLTFDVAYSSPFFDVGTLYYLAWFVVMNGAVIALTFALSRRSRPAAGVRG